MNVNKIIILVMAILCAASAGAQDFQRLKGYYRVYQTTDSALTYFWDGYMEIFAPLDSTDDATFCRRKFLGERRRKATKANDDDLFVQINLPNLEVTPLSKSISADEYSTRNNGDIYFLSHKAGNIARTDSTATIVLDELVGRPDHSLDMSQLKMYGVKATMTGYRDYEKRYTVNGKKQNALIAFGKHTEYLARYRGEDTDEKISVTSEFFVTDRQMVTRQQMKKIMKEKNHIWSFTIPKTITPLPEAIADSWQQLVEY